MQNCDMVFALRAESVIPAVPEFWRGKLSKDRNRTSPQSLAAAGSLNERSGDNRRSAAVVNFKDLNLSVDDELSEDASHPDEDPTNKAQIRTGALLRAGAQKNKLIIIMVLEDNYRYKMKYSPDYQGVDTEAVRLLGLRHDMQ
eukprot:gene5299-5534_t